MGKVLNLIFKICILLLSCSILNEVSCGETEPPSVEDYNGSASMDSVPPFIYYDTEESSVSTSIDSDPVSIPYWFYYDIDNVSTPTDFVKHSDTTPFAPDIDFFVSKLEGGGHDYSDAFKEEDMYVRANDIEKYLLQNKTMDFLSTFRPGYQRHVIRNQLKYCPFNRLCGFSLNLESLLSCCLDCSCDFPTCVKYKTCCPDKLFNHVNTLNSSTTQEIPHLLEGQKLQKDCIPLFLSKDHKRPESSAYGYATCPNGTAVDLSRNCTISYNANNITDLIDTVPVINRETGELYRNKYCALCNGEDIDNVRNLGGSLLCSVNVPSEADTEILHAVYINNICIVRFTTEQDLDACVLSISDCNTNGTDEQSACSLFRSIYLSDGNYFQNIFCSICNGYIPDLVTCPAQGYHGGGGFPFSTLLRLDERQRDPLNNIVIISNETDKCSEDQLYDPVLNICKDIMCSEITVLKSGTCVSMFETLENIIYVAFLRLIPTKTMQVSDAFLVSHHAINFIKEFLDGSELCSIQMEYKPSEYLDESGFSVVERSNLVYIDVRVLFSLSNSHNPYEIVAKVMKLHDSKQIFPLPESADKTVVFEFKVRDDISTKFDAIPVMPHSHYNLDSSLQGSDLELSVNHIPGNYCVVFAFRNLNIVKLTICPKVSISAFDIPWKETNNGLVFVNDSYVIKSTDYYFIDESNIMVCVDKYKQYLTKASQAKRNYTHSAESIASIVCSSVSISCLCFTFFLYCFFSKLRCTTPGKNNMSLALTLMIAQTLYLVGSLGNVDRDSVECIILGLTIHFTWLVALFWMNICTFHMFRVLSRTKVVSQSSGTRKLVIYHIYAHIMAAIFVSINIVVSYVTTATFGYGNEVCYISSQQLIIFTFAIPAALIVISNICMFVYVIIKIKRSPSVQKSVQNERNDIIVFAKLSTITGATWVFGFVYMWTGYTLLSYIFIVLNASQGVFIMFAFVINRRVYSMFRSQVLGETVTASDRRRMTSSTTVKS